jgi:2-hydroxymuconate-semialdehyde hydrolase
MLVGLPGREQILEAGGIRTNVYEAGAGPPLILLHGGIECGGAMWAPVVARLAESFRLIVPDAPGLGESEPVERIDTETFSAWFSDLLRAIDAHKPVLVAHSLLGSLAASYAARNSEDLRRLVVYGAPGIGSYRMPFRLKYVAIRFSIRPTPANAERFDRFALLDLDATRKRDPEWFAAFETYSRSRAAVPHVKRAMWQLIRAGTKRIPDELLRQIPVPVDLIWGEGDRMVPIDTGRSASSLHGWPLHVIPHAAHAPHIEQPEAFVRTLCSVLTTARHPCWQREETTS